MAWNRRTLAEGVRLTVLVPSLVLAFAPDGARAAASGLSRVKPAGLFRVFPGPTRGGVVGTKVTDVALRQRGGRNEATLLPFASLSVHPLTPGLYEIAWTVPAGTEAVEIPPCGNRKRLIVDGEPTALTPGPAVVLLDPSRSHELGLEVEASDYERRMACGYAPVLGKPQFINHGFMRLSFPSPSWAKGGGQAILYVPQGYYPRAQTPMLVGVHPWNGDHWTYANYMELVAAAEATGVLLLMPNGLGNSLYTREAEVEVMRARHAAEDAVNVDPQRVSIWGASMGGQGATTIGLHRPARFASITSYFGDAKFGVSGYTKTILPTEEAAHLVNPIDVIDNARHVPVWLIHGDNDKTAPVRESDELNAALTKRAYQVRYDRERGRGHEGSLVAKHADAMVRLAATAQAPVFPARVTFRSVRLEDVEAYGVHIERRSPGDAFVDLENKNGRVVVLASENVTRVTLAAEALGVANNAPVENLDREKVPVSWR
jgi:pimeloyl-ACP methyl ester carboxylesterase